MAPVSVAQIARKALKVDIQTRDNTLQKAQGKALVTGQSGTITYDSFINFAQNYGVGADNPLTTADYGFNPITRNRILLEWIHRGSWLGGVAVDVVADDMTRGGVELKGKINPKGIEVIEEATRTLKVWERVNELLRWDRLYGGCIAVHLVEGQDMKTPLRLETIAKGQYKGLAVLDRWMVQPTLNMLVTELGPDLGMPKFYDVVADAPALRGMRIHYSRCIRMEGIKMPYWQRLTENLWGTSILERLYDRMIAFDSATTGAAQLVYKAYLRTYKIKGLKELVSAGGPASLGVMAYVDFMRRFQNTEGITLMDGDDEFEAHTNTSFAGLSDALNHFGTQLAGALQIPLVRLFGMSPAGFNTGDTDLQMYYDTILQHQNEKLLVPVTKVYRAMAASEGVKLPDGFSLEFRSLWQMDEKEKSDILTAVVSAVVQANEAGLISDQVAMKELRQSSHNTGVFSNITDQDINSAEEEAAPAAESVLEKQAELQLEPEEKGKPAAKKPEPKKGDETKAKKKVKDDRTLELLKEVLRNEENKLDKVSAEKTSEGESLVRLHRNSIQKIKKQIQEYEKVLMASTRDTKSAAEMHFFHDLQIVVENPRGTLRNGKDWSVSMPTDYGYLMGTVGHDGDNVDCFVGDETTSTNVWIIEQLAPNSGSFDEHKVLLGYGDMASALRDYIGAYSDGNTWNRIGSISKLNMDQFKAWLSAYKRPENMP